MLVLHIYVEDAALMLLSSSYTGTRYRATLGYPLYNMYSALKPADDILVTPL
jgi:hypothetical protein